VRFSSLDELKPADRSRVGGKAWNCARLKQRGFPVPDGLVVPADAEEAVIAAVALDQWFDRWSPDERFAVRSSGLSEDAADQSFAGIHETHLDVARGDIAAAVRACRASADSSRARSYRQARNLPLDGGAPAVLVQRMIQARFAGVAFTVDPLTGLPDEMVINAAPGPGAAVVDGRIEPDEIRVGKRDSVVRSYRRGGHSSDGLLALSAVEGPIRELSTLLVAIEREYGSPQDVEWCYDGTQFWIVQSRPITTSTAEIAENAEIEWTRANLAEVLPDITSPQALQVFERLLNEAEVRALGRLLAPYDVLGPMVKPFFGRLYFNLSQFRHMCLVTRTPPAQMLRSVGHAGRISPEDEEAPRPPVATVLAAVPDFARLLIRHARAEPLVHRTEARIAAVGAALSARDPRTLADDEVWRTLTAWDRTGAEWLDVVLLLAGVGIFERSLRKICGRAGFPFERLLYSYLAAGERSVSAQQAFDLVELAGVARKDPLGLKGAEFAAALARFLQRYGHRGLYETDWALPRYAEDPSPILDAVRLHLGAPTPSAGAVEAPALSGVEGRLAAEAAEAIVEFEHGVSGIRRWTMLPRARWLLKRIKRYYVWREKCRSDLIRVLAIIRQWHLVLARRFVERGWLDRVEDYFLILFEEIGAVIEDPSLGSGLRAKAAARAEEIERYRRLQMPLLMRESQLPRLLRAAAVAQADGGVIELRGVPVSRGCAEGEVVVIADPGDFERMKRGAILVTIATDPSWTPLFTLAAGVVVEVGGVLSHASTVAREYGIPALANVRDATRRLRTGDRVLLNANEGVLTVLSPAPSRSS
jgi:rifampicin phosphotransferase